MGTLILRAESFAVALACLLYSFVRSSTRCSVENSPSCIAVINLTTNIGDMVCTTPLIGLLKKRFPKTHIVVVGRLKSAELLAHHPHIDLHIRFRSFWGALRHLKKIHPVFSVALNQSVYESGLGYLAGSRCVSTFFYRPQASLSFRIVKHLFLKTNYTPGNYLPDEYLTLLSPLGVPIESTDLCLGICFDTISRFQSELRDAGVDPQRLVVILPGAGQSFRVWPTKYFGDVAIEIWRKHGLFVVVAGGAGDSPLYQEIAHRAIGVPIYDATGQSIEKLKALISLARVVISNDSGGAQIARAFSVPTVVVVGASDAAEHHKETKNDRIVKPVYSNHSLAQSIVTNYKTFDTESATELIKSISPNQVLHELDKILSQ